MGRPLMILASMAIGTALVTTGCRSCSSNYDYAPPVANGYCDACGTHRCGSNSGGCVTGDCATGDCAMYDTPLIGEEVVAPYEGGELMPEAN